MYHLILSNFARHISLNAAETEQVTAQLQHKKLKKNHVLLHAGEVNRYIYFVSSGCLRLYSTDNAGVEHNNLFCPENWWASDIASFSEQTPAFYSISTLEDTEVLYLSFPVLEQLYIQVPKLERFFRILVQNGFHLYQRRITSNMSKPAPERYHLFQEQYPGLEQRIAQKHIASYLGITPEFLSMIRRRKR
jgi:CRP-like cAMP-binding protein